MNRVAMSPPRKLRPGVVGYVLGLVLIIASVVAALVLIAMSLVGRVDELRSTDPIVDQGVVELDAEVTYTVYYSFGGRLVPPLVTDPAGVDVAMTEITINETLSLDGANYQAGFRFTSTAAGEYRVANDVDRGASPILITESPFNAGDFIPGILVGTLLGLLGLGLMLVTLVRRRADRKRRIAEMGGSGGGSPPHQPSAYSQQLPYNQQPSASGIPVPGAPGQHAGAGGGFGLVAHPPQQSMSFPPSPSPPPPGTTPQGGSDAPAS